jgi:hypothetical protein
MPVILATQEAEIRKISVQSQAPATHPQDPTSGKKNHKRRAGRVTQMVSAPS